MILECTLEGPDVAVYTYVAKKLCPNLQIEKPITKGDKKTLLKEASLEAKTLLDTGCDHVFIIWDRIPRWGVPGNCINDKSELIKSLQSLNVDLGSIILCCIDEMMESWIIADSRGFMSWIRSKTHHVLPEIGDHKSRAKQTSPKERIRKYLKDNYNKLKYSDYEDNIEIVNRLPDLNRAANWNSSFRFFKESIETICPN